MKSSRLRVNVGIASVFPRCTARLISCGSKAWSRLRTYSKTTATSKLPVMGNITTSSAFRARKSSSLAVRTLTVSKKLCKMSTASQSGTWNLKSVGSVQVVRLLLPGSFRERASPDSERCANPCFDKLSTNGLLALPLPGSSIPRLFHFPGLPFPGSSTPRFFHFPGLPFPCSSVPRPFHSPVLPFPRSSIPPGLPLPCSSIPQVFHSPALPFSGSSILRLFRSPAFSLSPAYRFAALFRSP